MASKRNPPRPPRYPCRVTSRQLPALLHGLPTGTHQVIVEGEYAEDEFAAAFPGLEIKECLYALGEPSGGLEVIPLTPGLLANGVLGCFASILAGETAEREGRELEWDEETIARRSRWAYDHSRPYQELELPVLGKVFEMAQGYPQLADRDALHDPEEIEAAGQDAYAMGLHPTILCYPLSDAPEDY